MNEFYVIVIMNKTEIALAKKNNKNCEKNLEIQKYLEDEAFFFKISPSKAYEILQTVGIKQDKIKEVYEKLISPIMFYDLISNKKLDPNDESLVVKYK